MIEMRAENKPESDVIEVNVNFDGKWNDILTEAVSIVVVILDSLAERDRSGVMAKNFIAEVLEIFGKYSRERLRNKTEKEERS